MVRAEQPKQIGQMTASEWEAAFPDEDACRTYLVEHRWPGRVACPRCGNANVFPASTRPWNWHCYDCDPKGRSHRFSHIVGTIFENTNKPLRQWFRVIHLMLSQKGISVLQIHRMTGFGTYRTAWSMCQRVRAGLATEEFRKVMGITEVDEILLAVLAKNRRKDKRGKGGGTGAGKTPVIGAVDELSAEAPRCCNESLACFSSAHDNGGVSA